jgi:hypothetical protein
MSSLVNDLYQQSVDRMTSAEKLARMQSMFNWMRDLYLRQAKAKLGDVSPERLKWEVALRMYESDPPAKKLIEEHIQHVFS